MTATIAFDSIEPALNEAAQLAAMTRDDGSWTDDQRARYHDLVQQIYASVRPLFQRLVEANLMSATFYGADREEFAWFEVDEVDCGGTINFGGRYVLECTEPAPRFLEFVGGD